ncbi:hypothetical protein V1505DRAFT_387949 [Lipomyces doorenjongii]
MSLLCNTFLAFLIAFLSFAASIPNAEALPWPHLPFREQNCPRQTKTITTTVTNDVTKWRESAQVQWAQINKLQHIHHTATVTSTRTEKVPVTTTLTIDSSITIDITVDKTKFWKALPQPLT